MVILLTKIRTRALDKLNALRNNDPTLISVSCYKDHLGVKGALLLADALKHNTILKRLHVDNNELGDEGIHALADALTKNTTLLELNVSSNHLTDVGAHYLANALTKNTTLTRLNVSFNDFSNQAFADALRCNTTLTHLDISNNDISSDGALALADALKHNTTLSHLHIEYNNIGGVGTRALAEALKHNTTLRLICIHHNYMEWYKLQDVLEQNVGLLYEVKHWGLHKQYYERNRQLHSVARQRAFDAAKCFMMARNRHTRDLHRVDKNIIRDIAQHMVYDFEKDIFKWLTFMEHPKGTYTDVNDKLFIMHVYELLRFMIMLLLDMIAWIKCLF